MNITEMKVDTKGRVTIPNSFLKAKVPAVECVGPYGPKRNILSICLK